MIKQVIIVRKDLNMRKGKMIAQGCHASLKVFLDKISYLNGYVSKTDNFIKTKYEMKIDPITKEMKDWIEGNFAKIVVSCDSAAELIDYKKKAELAKLPVALITDSGLTEFNGVPTITCIAIGPAKSEDIDKITGELKLL